MKIGSEALGKRDLEANLRREVESLLRRGLPRAANALMVANWQGDHWDWDWPLHREVEDAWDFE